MAVTPSGNGYWVLNGDTGKIFSYGDAVLYGEPATGFVEVGREFVPNMVQIVATPDGLGYWVYEVGQSDLGTVSHFGNAGFFGDTTTFVQARQRRGPQRLGRGHGGDTDRQGLLGGSVRRWRLLLRWTPKFYGSTGGIHLAQKIIGITATTTGKGYWLYAADGGVSHSVTRCSPGRREQSTSSRRWSASARDPAGPGYWLPRPTVESSRSGQAPYLGSIAQFRVQLHRPIFAIATKSRRADLTRPRVRRNRARCRPSDTWPSGDEVSDVET